MSAPSEPVPRSHAFARKPSILVVDDDPMLRLLVVEALLGADFDVVEADAGATALAMVGDRAPDMILLDVMMPDLDGFEVCRRLRSHPLTAVTPILLMTGLDDVASINRAYEVGATDFVTKPVNYTLLPHRLRYLLRAAAAFVSERENAERLSRAQRLAKLVQWELDLGDRTFRWSRDAREVYNLPSCAGSVEHVFLRWVHPDDRDRVRAVLHDAVSHSLEYRVILPPREPAGGDGPGEVRFVRQEAVIVQGPDQRVLLSGSAQDVTALRLAERRVHDLAFYDRLTKLPNRAFLNDFLRPIAAPDNSPHRTAAILVVGLDGFKRVNDTFGVAVGDELLSAVGARISGSLPDNDVFVARLEGDKFAIVLLDLRRAEDAIAVAQRLIERLSSGFRVGGAEVVVSTSIGIAWTPEHGHDGPRLVGCAEVALAAAKAQGASAIVGFSNEIRERAQERIRIEKGLRVALRRVSASPGEAPRELFLMYQPKVDVPSRRLVGVEALLRWEPAGRPPVSPATFIPIAEESGLIIPLGAWVLKEACVQAKHWSEQGYLLPVAVNVSARQFRERDFVDLVATTLAEVGLDASLLELEITEGLVMEDSARSREILTRLKGLGVRIALDDFGTGYSSLSYLTRLPLDALKIDRSFVRALGAERGAAITAAIMGLAQKLGIKVIVEGVETEDQLAFVESQGTAVVQGFYFARPLMPAAVPGWHAPAWREPPLRTSPPALGLAAELRSQA